MKAALTLHPVLLPALAAVLFLMTTPNSHSAEPGRLIPTELRCESAKEPLGLDHEHPALSWIPETTRKEERGQSQSAYQVLVASSPELLARNRGDLWDSGQVTHAAPFGVAYAGAPLRSGQRVYWKVKVWDRKRKASAWSEPSWWEMGLLGEKPWSARWIRRPEAPPASERELFAENPAPLLRKEWTLRGPVKRARAYVTGLGYYELRLNGQKVGDHVLDPGWTSFHRRVFYSTYDVTSQLRPGKNALGIMLGNGWYNPLPLRMWGHLNLREHLTIGLPRAILQLEIEYADGTHERVVTDESWKAGDGPILRNSVYLGEEYDARREQTGWDLPGFDDHGWKPAVPATEPLGPLQAQSLEPIRVGTTLEPKARTEPKPGVFIFDLGQNFAGRVRLRVRGERGARVTLRYGELLYPDGTLNPMTSVTGQIKRRAADPNGAPAVAWQSDAYTCKGDGQEEYTPRFTFHGFRYVEVTGYPGTPPMDAVRGELLHSAVEDAGEFHCSDPLYNQIQHLVRWAQLSNMFSVQSDCPHREKFGYGGDIAATSDMAMLNLNMARFYAKAAQDFADAARPNGGFTETAPFVGIADEGLGGGAGPVEWGTAHPLLVWQLYQYYGDRRLLEAQFPLARRWMRLLESSAKDGILDNGISDHESLAPKPRALTGTAYYYLNARLVAQMAAVFGNHAEAERCSRLADEIRSAFNRRFLKPGTGRYDTGTQACQAIALALDLVPVSEREAALRVLLEDIRAHDGHLTTGIFGTKYLLEALSANGQAEVAAQVVGQKTFPGWGWMVENGATTLWEHWAFSDNTFSHNHPMFGSVSEWFFRWVAGIQPAPGSMGWDRLVLRPQRVGNLRSASGEHRTVLGKVVSAWQVESGGFTWNVRIPVGCTAEVHVPAKEISTVREGDRSARRAPGLKFLRMEKGAAVFEAGSGEYHFRVEDGG